ncbi:hypothetical protein ASG31_06360 [Chryseobacterium sp. Leaf404]|uniref:hypothetical protein n=1 Tax=unclassified Chryseobacterium TaxID=2593645 RepID=UPI0006F65F57|nr:MULTISPECIES: hypothetical protein [unclassified Chryseobacterium]KQT18347.1 hypothetical protein ASG31_06360 [Chryseobacterium sp. Leaf404]
MFKNTANLSLFLYGFFVFVGVISILLVYRIIRNKTFEIEQIDKFLDYFKWVIVTLAISSVTLIISDLFKERDQDIKEVQYFDKYINQVKNQDSIETRYQFVRYLATVAPSGYMKESWENYYDSIKKDYREISLKKTKLAKANNISNPSSKQIVENLKTKEELKLLTAPLTEEKKMSDEWYIIAGGDTTIDEAKNELIKATKININANIIKKGNVFRTVLMGYFSKEAAETDLFSVRKIIRNDAYIVNGTKWCSSLEESQECLICK